MREATLDRREQLRAAALRWGRRGLAIALGAALAWLCRHYLPPGPWHALCAAFDALVALLGG